MEYRWEQLTPSEEKQVVRNLQARRTNLLRFDEKKAKAAASTANIFIIPNQTKDDANENIKVIDNILTKIGAKANE